MKPKRIQRKRTKGFNLQKANPNGLPVIYVGRGSKWGNPFKLDGDGIFVNASYRRTILSKWVCVGGRYDAYCKKQDVVNLFRLVIEQDEHDNPDIQHWINYFKYKSLSELRGKNLACWCSLSEPCHADILLKLANK